MAEGVAEIEQRAVALLALVAHDEVGLRPAALRHRLVALAAAREDPAPVPLAPGEERRIVDQAVFCDLGIAGAHLARRQGVEKAGVGEDEARLVKGADEVLAVTGVDAGLAADRGIDLGKQRRRHLHEAHAPAHDRGGEAGEVPDDAAAERDDEVAALDLRSEDGVADAFELAIGFRRLSRRDGEDLCPQALSGDGGGQLLRIERADMPVRDDRRGPGAEGGDARGGAFRRDRGRRGCRRPARRARPARW